MESNKQVIYSLVQNANSPHKNKNWKKSIRSVPCIQIRPYENVFKAHSKMTQILGIFISSPSSVLT